MPTGAGKSMCYQLPAIIQEGTAIIISPLIALMKNQVDQMNAFGINARFLNSTLTKAELTRVKKETMEGKVKMLYVAPESLNKETNLEFLKKSHISFVAIDEAHCISEWGHDFRPEYRKIKHIIKSIGDLPVIALTATATPKVQIDIQKNLTMEDADIFKSSFNRKNLYYEIRPKRKDSRKELIRFVKSHSGKAGIIYCLSRKKVEEIAGFLKVNGIKAAPYHAGLDNAVRVKNQDDFLNEDIDVIVATIAFGMGIDKPDVRFVVHYDAPKSLEGYYQETGRAGRDGLQSECLMFYKYEDLLKLEKFNKDKSVTERENARLLLNEVAAFAESAVCRRKQLLHYFGENIADEETGGHDCCDNHRYPRESFDGKEAITKALKVVNSIESRFDLSHLVNILTGNLNQYVKSYDHDQLAVFGIGKDDTDDFWRSVIRQSTLLGYLEKDIEQIGVLKLTDKGIDFLAEPESVTLFKDNEFESDGSDEDDDIVNARSGSGHDEALFAILKDLRKKVAKQKGLPPYVIFQDPSLEEMATVYPQTKDELIQINGVGRGKSEKFGKPFLEAIKKYVEENDIITASDVLIKSSGEKSKSKIFIIQQIDRKVDLEEIADNQKMSFDDLLEELEHICYAGTKIDISYYIDEIIDEDRQEEIYDFLMESESDDTEELLDEFGDDYDEDDLRLVRIKFLSEYAN